MIITNNLLSANAALNVGLVTGSKNKSLEKLSSGYRVNRASDDAAGLAISEKMRSQVRGLMRAAENTRDGISLVQTTDGATDQVAGILQRMRELSVQALNIAVNTEDDRAKIQQEFDQLQSEMDRINDQTEFNKKPCFNHYETDHYVTQGNITWVQDQVHSIDNYNNSMTVKYKTEPDTVDENGNAVVSPEKEVTIRVPNGLYTTQQLADEIDDAISALGLEPEKIGFEYTDEGTCNLVLEKGAEITDMSGGLTYLFHDEYAGSEVGSLIGTTIFEPGTKGLRIYPGHNDQMSFTIQYMDGRGSRPMSIQIDTSSKVYYTREEMIDYLNHQLAGTDVSALEYGEKSIMLGSDKAIVTGLCGNMFEIDDPSVPGTIVATSVFYDNTKYGITAVEPAVFTGGDVVSAAGQITIGDDNNVLKVRVNDKTGEYVDVHLNNGSYSPGNMIRELNRAFTAAGLPITASDKDTDTTVRMTNGNTATLKGFKITTTDKGRNSSIEFDTSTKAYQTLFTDRVYSNQGKEINERKRASYNVYKNYFSGSKAFADGSSNLPLVVDNTNNTLSLRLYETPVGGSSAQRSYSVHVANGTYTTGEQILSALSAGLSSAGLDGKVSASLNDDGTIKLTPSLTDKTVGQTNSSTVYTTIGFVTDAAYRAFFVGTTNTANENQSVISSSSTHPELTISENAVPENPASLRYRFRVYGNGVAENRYVDFTDGTYDRASFIEKLNQELAGGPDTYTSKGSSLSSTSGRTNNYSGSASVTSEPETSPISASARGSGFTQQGTTNTDENMYPATYTINNVPSVPMTLNSTNNELVIRVNDSTYHIRLEEKTYNSAQEIADELQSKMDTEITRAGDLMKVSLDGSKLKFETVQVGESVSFGFRSNEGSGSVAYSTFLHELCADKQPASVTVRAAGSYGPLYPINMPAGATLTLKVNGENKSISWDSAATYANSSEFVTALNAKLNTIGLSASASSSGLTLTTLSKGIGSSITINTAASPEFSEAVFGSRIKDTPATLTFSSPLKEDSETVAMKDGENSFRIKIGANTYTYTLDAGVEYTRQGIIDKLNSQHSDVATASINSNGQLVFTTKATGGSVNITGWNVTSAGMFGQTVTHHPGVKASLTDDNHLKLTGEDTSYNYSILMFRKEGSDILPASYETSDIAVSRGRAGSQHVGIYEGSAQNALPNSVTITSENNALSFSTNINGSYTNYSMTIPMGTYNLQQLQGVVQNAFDSKLGAGAITVDYNSMNGLRFTTGSDYEINDIDYWSGSFYTKIIRGDVDVNEKVAVSSHDGSQNTGDTYIVGRKDVKNQTTVIQPNVNDSFSLKLYINNTPKTFSFKLDPGSYNSDQLVSMLNNKLSSAAEGLGLPRDIVKAAVGRYNTGVVGSNDSNSLDFYLNPDVDLTPGKYRIEGLEGTSLFDIFYKTVGNLIAAYTTGTKDLSGGVDISEGKQDFSITVDDVVYNYTIDPAGRYTSEEFVDKLNELIQAGSPKAPIKASLSRGAIQFSHENIGKHTVTSVRGPAIQEFFYASDAAYGEKDDQWLQVGANEMQGITFKRYSVSSHALGVNTVNLTEKKYADKALTRIDVAMSNLMSARSKFGALQNRLEFTYNVDTNSAINLQGAESRIRDADMAEEAMQLAKKNVLEQAGVAMISQAIRQPEAVLSLLKS